MDYAGYVLTGYGVVFGALGALRVVARAPRSCRRAAGAAGEAALERLVTEIAARDDPGAGEGFDESSTELDLTPRTVAPAREPRKKRPIGVYVALAAVVLGIGFVVLQGLGDATLYFRNVDEVVANPDALGTRRFRLQGLVNDDVATERRPRHASRSPSTATTSPSSTPVTRPTSSSPASPSCSRATSSAAHAIRWCSPATASS